MPKIAILTAIALVFFTVSNSSAAEFEFLEVTEPEFLELTDQEFLTLTQQQLLQITGLKSLKVSKPKSLVLDRFPEGEYTPAERENTAYDRCAKQEGFDAQLNCALEALGIEGEEDY